MQMLLFLVMLDSQQMMLLQVLVVIVGIHCILVQRHQLLAMLFLPHWPMLKVLLLVWLNWHHPRHLMLKILMMLRLNWQIDCYHLWHILLRLLMLIEQVDRIQ